MNKLLMIPALALTFGLSFAHAKGEMKVQREAVNAACAEDAKTAGCEGKEMGKGLMKCIHAHKKSDANFKMTESCEKAVGDMKAARKEHKSKK